MLCGALSEILIEVHNGFSYKKLTMCLTYKLMTLITPSYFKLNFSTFKSFILMISTEASC